MHQSGAHLTWQAAYMCFIAIILLTCKAGRAVIAACSKPWCHAHILKKPLCADARDAWTMCPSHASLMVRASGLCGR